MTGRCSARPASLASDRSPNVQPAVSSDNVRPLLSASVQEQLSAPSTSFQLTYDLGLAALCTDFQENIEFQFSLGWTALVTRFIGAANAKRALSGPDPRLQVICNASTLLHRLGCPAGQNVNLLSAGQHHLQGPGRRFHRNRSSLRNVPGVHDGAGDRRCGMYIQVSQASLCLRCVPVPQVCPCPSGVALSGLACHRTLRVTLRAPLPVREAHLD